MLEVFKLHANAYMYFEKNIIETNSIIFVKSNEQTQFNIFLKNNEKVG